MFIEHATWLGLPEENMQEVYDRIGPSMGRSTSKNEVGDKPRKGEFTGVIHSPIQLKGFGFLQPDDGGADVYFHIDKNPKAYGLARGTRVAYDLESSLRSGRTYAVNISVIGGKR